MEMPRYEYKCKKCDTTFEVVHGINENVETCESCGGKVRRVFHPIGIVFKGSGFYATDSRNAHNKTPGQPKEEKDSAEKVEPKPPEDTGTKKDSKGAADDKVKAPS